MTHLRTWCTLVATATPSLSPRRKHSVSDTESSRAMAAPLAEVRSRLCAASPTCTMCPPAEVHLGWGLRKDNFHRTIVPGCVFFIASTRRGSQLSKPVKAAAICPGVTPVDHDSVAVLSSWREVQYYPQVLGFIAALTSCVEFIAILSLVMNTTIWHRSPL